MMITIIKIIQRSISNKLLLHGEYYNGNSLPALRSMTQYAITQMMTDMRDPAAVASPMGSSVAGNSFEVM